MTRSDKKPTPQQIAHYLRSQGLMAVPQQQAVQVGAPRPMAPMGPPAPMGRRAGGGGATFTGVTAGTYAFGGGSITVNSKGQITAITAEGAVELMVGPAGFRGPDFGYEPPGPGVESYVTERSIGGVGFSAFRLSPVDPSSARWSYTLPSAAPAGRYRIRLTLEYTDVEPAPSFAGLLGFGLAEQPDDLSAVVFVAATDVQVQSVGTDTGEALSVLEWQFDNPSSKPFIACVLTKPDGAEFPGLIYLYEATLSFIGSSP